MANPETVLARAAPKGGQYEAYVGGGLAQFTSAEVGIALSGKTDRDGEHHRLSEGAVRILLLRYANGDENDTEALIRELVADDGKQKDWVSRAVHTLLCRLAVLEFLYARRCSKCEGRQIVMAGDLLVPCENCGQSGYEPYSAAKRARRIGIPVKTYRGGPAERDYMGKIKRLSRWEQEGLWHVIDKTRSRN